MSSSEKDMIVDRVLCALGMKCPRPLFEVHRNIKLMADGQVLEVSADDRAFRLDIEAWCGRTGHALLGVTDEGDRIIARIRKRG